MPGVGNPSLRSLLGTHLLASVPDFVKDNGEGDLNEEDPAAGDYAVKVKANDVKLRKALEKHVSPPELPLDRSFAEAERIIRQNVKWDVYADSFRDALQDFRAQWMDAVATHGLSPLLLAGEPQKKRATKLLLSLVKPDAFRTMLDTVREARGIKDPVALFTAIKELEPAYTLHVVMTKETPRKGGRKAAGGAGRDTSSTTDSSTRTCYNCGESGHVKRYCPLLRDSTSSKGSKASGGQLSSSSGSRSAHSSAASGRKGMPHALAARTATTNTSGDLRIGDVTLPFKFDSGATESMISRANADRVIHHPAVKEVRLSHPKRVRVATNGAVPPLMAYSRLKVDATLHFARGGTSRLRELMLLVVDGLTDAEVLLGDATIRQKVDLDDTARRAFIVGSEDAAPLPPYDDDSGTDHIEPPYEDDDQDDDEEASVARLVADADTTASVSRLIADADASARRLIQQPPADADDDKDLPPEIGPNNPAEIEAALRSALSSASKAGLSPSAVSDLTRLVMEDCRDVFRLTISADPPADVPPIRVEMREGWETITHGKRQYNKEASEFIHQTMDMLTANGLVFLNPSAVVASPAVAVKKPGADPMAPLTKRYRLTVDLRRVNSYTKPTIFPLPDANFFAQQVDGMCYFGTVDLDNAFWQLPLHPDCQDQFSILTDRGVYTPTRLIQGSRNASGPFQATMIRVLRPIVFKGVLLYIDDILVYAATEADFVRTWFNLLRILQEHGFKVNAKKIVLYAAEIAFCGHLYSKDGVRFNPEFIDTILKMAKPEDAAQLRTYLACVNWMRTSIARFAVLTAILYTILKVCLRHAANQRQAAAARVKLKDHGWDHRHDKAFVEINRAVANNVSMRHLNPDWIVCVWTDASDLAWSGVVTQCSPEDFLLPFAEQTHEPLAFSSGTFTESQLRWTTWEKEGFGNKETYVRNHHVLGRVYHSYNFSDHENLKYLLGGDTVGKQASDRIQRWRIAMSAYNFTMRHVPGESNIVADMFSRWANPALTHAPTTSDSLALAATVADPDPFITGPHDPITEEEIKEAQRATQPEIKTALTAGEDGVLRTAHHRIYLPTDSPLRARIMRQAHDGASGHRGINTTHKWIAARFFWTTLHQDVRDHCRQCVVCQKTRGGKTTPLPFLLTPQEDGPHKCLHFDYMYISEPTAATPHAHCYVLVLLDSFSKYVELVPTPAADSETTALALLDWFKRFTIVRKWTSDRGSHFINATITRLQQLLGSRHHFTAVYAPWSNGQVERVNLSIRETLSAIMLDNGIPQSDWPYVLPVVQSVINNAPSAPLGGLSPVTAHMGIPPSSPLNVIFASDKEPKTIGPSLSKPTIATLVRTLQQDLHSVVTYVRAHQPQPPPEDTTHVLKPGDLVLTAKLGARHADKTAPIWEGPARVLASDAHKRVYTVQDLASGHKRELHASHLKRYIGTESADSPYLKAIAARGTRGYVISSIDGHRFTDTTTELNIRWEAYEQPTWEPIRVIHEDAPDLVLAYIDKLKDATTRRRLLASLPELAPRDKRKKR